MAREESHSPKIGEGHASAMFRQGLRELRGALYPESNVAQPAEYGLYGTRTPGEVAEARRGDERDLEEEQPREAESRDRLDQGGQNREDRGVDFEDFDR